jgi:glycosyltransferase involved in cell wall biosynthesis
MPPTVVAIPAKDEAEELPGCLAALAAQKGYLPDAVVLCLNNCTDGSASLVRRLILSFPVHVIETSLPPGQASVGVARRTAMEKAAEIAGPDGILLTTDADGRTREDWLAHNLDAISRGADAVAGQVEIEPEGAKLIPAHLHAIDARECAYAALLDEIQALLNPDPADPWPRHDEHSGASIAVTVDAWRRAGGIPDVSLAEDRAFIDRLRLVDARIRHEPGVSVVVSARTVGRAEGGMADTMRRRIAHPDEFLDERLEPVGHALRRARICACLHAIWNVPLPSGRIIAGIARRLRLPPEDIAALLATPYFGACWAAVEARSPVLQRTRVALKDLTLETARAVTIRDRIRRGADPVDTRLIVAA